MLRPFDVVRPGRLQLSMEQMGVGYQHLGQNDPSMDYPSFFATPQRYRCSATKNVDFRARLPHHKHPLSSAWGKVG